MWLLPSHLPDLPDRRRGNAVPPGPRRDDQGGRRRTDEPDGRVCGAHVPLPRLPQLPHRLPGGGHGGGTGARSTPPDRGTPAARPGKAVPPRTRGARPAPSVPATRARAVVPARGDPGARTEVRSVEGGLHGAVAPRGDDSPYSRPAAHGDASRGDSRRREGKRQSRLFPRVRNEPALSGSQPRHGMAPFAGRVCRCHSEGATVLRRTEHRGGRAHGLPRDGGEQRGPVSRESRRFRGHRLRGVRE